MDEIMGRSRIPGNRFWAQIQMGMRVLGNMKLGRVLFAAVTDLPNIARQIKYNGNTMLEGWNVARLGINFDRLSSDEMREAANAMGAYSDNMQSFVYEKFFIGDTMPGWLSKVEAYQFRFNMLKWWTEAHKRATALFLGQNAAHHAGKAFGDLNLQFRTVLQQFGIHDVQWDLLRQTRHMMADGRAYLVPEAIRDLPDDEIVAAIRKLHPTRKRAPNQRDIDEFKLDLEMDYLTYITEMTRVANIEPGLGERAAVLRGKPAGSLMGFVTRTVMQFKTFGVTLARGPFHREAFGFAEDELFGVKMAKKGVDPSGGFFRALREGRASARGIARLGLQMTMLGFVANQLKDLSEGKGVPDFTQEDVLLNQTLRAAMQGGGFGLYGDFLFGMSDRFGGNRIFSFLGPGIASIEKVADLTLKAGGHTAGLLSDEVDSPSAWRGWLGEAGKFARDHTGVFNLWYTRGAFDWLVGFETANYLRPGIVDEATQRLLEERGQEYVFFGPPE
jgi:hypothetical protein